MRESVKNLAAMIIATVIWALGFLIPISTYFLFESGPVIEEAVLLLVVVILFLFGVLLARKNKRLKAALEFPLFPNL